MANEEKSPQKERNLDERLADFYGPALHDQPLSTLAWTRLQSRLSTRNSLKSRLKHWLRRRRYRYAEQGNVPAFIEHAFSAIVYDARLPQSAYTSALLHCSFKARLQVPTVRIASWGRRNIKLMLPLQQERAVDPPELDVLLATGLARFYRMRQSRYTLKWLLLLSIEPLALLGLLLFWLYNHSVNMLPIAITIGILIGVGIGWGSYVLKRSIALHADRLLVQWIGRSRACAGLHLLAGRSNNAATKRTGWGEPTLRERIARVCGTSVTVEDERLTLVR